MPGINRATAARDFPVLGSVIREYPTELELDCTWPPARLAFSYDVCTAVVVICIVLHYVPPRSYAGLDTKRRGIPQIRHVRGAAAAALSAAAAAVPCLAPCAWQSSGAAGAAALPHLQQDSRPPFSPAAAASAAARAAASCSLAGGRGGGASESVSESPPPNT